MIQARFDGEGGLARQRPSALHHNHRFGHGGTHASLGERGTAAATLDSTKASPSGIVINPPGSAWPRRRYFADLSRSSFRTLRPSISRPKGATGRQKY